MYLSNFPVKAKYYTMSYNISQNIFIEWLWIQFMEKKKRRIEYKIEYKTKLLMLEHR